MGIKHLTCSVVHTHTNLISKVTDILTFPQVIPNHFKESGVLCYTLHSKNCIRMSVRLSIPLSVRPSAHHLHSHLGAFFNQFSSNLLLELILGRSVLGLQMGKFWQISTELWSLIDVRNWFSLSIFGIPLPILSTEL